MSDWAGIGWADRYRRLHAGWKTAVVFVVAGVLTFPIDNSWLERMADPLIAPPLGYGDRAMLALVVGWAVATAYALVQWLRSGEEADPSVAPLADDPLRVEPLAAGRELGPRFDESPYLAPPPPTPDSRLDPESTLAEPRWRPGAADSIERQDDWDRSVQDRFAGEARSIFDLPAVRSEDEDIGPDNAAQQWDDAAEWDEDRPAVRDEWAISPPAAGAHSPPPPLPEPEPDSPVDPEEEWSGDERREGQEEFDGPDRRVRSVPPPSSDDRELPSTAALLDRLAALTEGGVRRSAPARPSGDAAERLADALKALRTAA